MKRPDRYARWPILLGLLWGGGVTLLRGLRSPNDWAEAYWLISYDFGFLKRALPGTLLKPFITGQSAASQETTLAIVSFFLLAIFCMIIVKLCYDILQSNEFSTTSVFAIAVFLTSPFVVMSGHLNGYFDNLIIMLSALALLLTLRGHLWAAALVLSAGVLVHETILLIGFPAVVWTAWLYRRQTNRNSSTPVTIHYLLPLTLPLVMFAVLVVYQAAFLEARTTGRMLAAYLAQFGFVQRDRPIIVALAYVTSFGEYLATEGPQLLERLLSLRFLIIILPSLFLLLVFARSTLRARAIAPVMIAAAIIIPFLPLSLHAIAWDTSRIFTYPLIVTLLIIWAECKFVPILRSVKSHPLAFGLASTLVIMTTILVRTPLMDGEVDKASDITYRLLYVPLFLVLAGVILFRPAHNHVSPQ